MNRVLFKYLTSVLLLAQLAACGHQGSTTVTSSSLSESGSQYSVGGSVSGLTQAGLVLTMSSGSLTSTVAPNPNAQSFQFPDTLPTGAMFSVTITASPANAICQLGSPTGAVAAANVNSISVDCLPATDTVGGTLVGLLSQGLVLSLVSPNNAVQTLSVDSTATAFRFLTSLTHGSNYTVSVSNQPTGESCQVQDGSGTLAAGNVSSVAIVCTPLTYTVGGTISGLTASGLILGLTSQSATQVTTVATGASLYSFTSGLTYGSNYSIGIIAQPVGLYCQLSHATGTIGAGNDTTVAVTCSVSAQYIGGTISGLISQGLVLTLTASIGSSQTITLDAYDTSFYFNNPVAYHATYSVAVSQQPTGLNCVANALSQGVIASSDITTIKISCTPLRYSVGGTISGLGGAGLTLKLTPNSGAVQTLSPSANATRFTFTNSIPYNTTIVISIAQQPSGYTCTLSGGTNIVVTANITSVAVACQTSYTVGGTITGLTLPGMVLILTPRSGQVQSLAVQANATSFVFPSGLYANTAFAVTIQSPLPGLSCSVGSGSGTVSNANITSVAVTCTVYPGALTGGTGYSSNSVLNDLFAGINNYRTSCGMPPLIEDSYLDIAAGRHANWMSENSSTSQTEASGSSGYTNASYADRATAANFTGTANNEIELSGTTNDNTWGSYGTQDVGWLAGNVYKAAAIMWPSTYVGLGDSTHNYANAFYDSILFGNPTSALLSFNTTDVVTFPCEGTTNLYYSETPDGISTVPPNAGLYDPTDPTSLVWGAPVTVMGNAEVLLTAATYTYLSNGTVITVPNIQMLDHVHDSNHILQSWQAVVYPANALNPLTTYTVTIAGTVGGAAFTKTIHFTTSNFGL